MSARTQAAIELASLKLALVEAKTRLFHTLDLEDQAAFGANELAYTAALPEQGALLRARDRLEDFALGLRATPPAGWAAADGAPQARTLH